jgi:hypothetical protein
MTGTPIVIERCERIELGQKMPWVAGLLFAAGYPLVCFILFSLYAREEEVIGLWVFIAVFPSVFVLAGMAVYWLRQPPILWVAHRTGTLVVPRLNYKGQTSNLEQIQLDAGPSLDGDGAKFTVTVLRFSSHHQALANKVIFVSHRGNLLREAWAQFLSRIAASKAAEG